MAETEGKPLSASQRAALAGQVAEGALVELGTLREQTASAKLELDRLRSLSSRIARDRGGAPAAVRGGGIWGLGAWACWPDATQRSQDLQDSLNGMFEERLRLLSAIPDAQDDLATVRSLKPGSTAAMPAALQDVLSDAERYLKDRLQAMEALLDLYNQQAAIASEAYDQTSKYSEELGEAMLAARNRALLARAPQGISVGTIRGIGQDLAALPTLEQKAVAQFSAEGRPAQSAGDQAFRVASTALLLFGALLVWLRVPRWLARMLRDEGAAEASSAKAMRFAELASPVARALLLTAVLVLALEVAGFPDDWVVAAFALLATWAAYFAVLVLLRELFAPRDARFRILPLRTETARHLFALVRALTLWSAIVLPVIWGLSILGYGRQDALVLLSVVHVCGLAILAGAVVYARGGPREFLPVAEGAEAGPLHRWAALAAPAALAVIGGIAAIKAAGYVNLGTFLTRVICLDAPVGAVALGLDALARQRLAKQAGWLKAARLALWGIVLAAQIPVLQLRYHHWLAVAAVLRRPLFTVGQSQASAWSLLKAVLLVVGAYLVARLVRSFLERSELLGRYSQGVRYAFSSLTFYVLLAAGVFWAMLAGGFPLSTLTVLAGMAGIGIGFGLQDIVRNFIAGIILLIERPLAVGDYVDIGGVTGRVAGISLRSTVVRTPDNIHILVPNADLISQQVTNLSHRDLTMRLRIPVGVSYGSDVDEVIRVLVGVGRDDPDVLDDPEPEAWLVGFGDSAVDFQLNAWIADPSTMIGTRVRLNLAVWRALKAAGIEIPFPQRDLHIRSADGLSGLLQPPGDRAGASGEQRPV